MNVIMSTPFTHLLAHSVNMCLVVRSRGFGSKETWISILFVPLISTVAKRLNLSLHFLVGKMEVWPPAYNILVMSK